MDVVTNVLWMVGGAVLGTAISVIVDIYRSYRRYDAAPDITGVWLTTYQAAALPGNPWVPENAMIQRHMGKLRFHTFDNQQNDEIEGEADLVGLDHMLGRWRQVDKRGPNHGVFVLTIAPSGRLMYGFWCGVTDTGEKRFGGWVLARDKRDLSKGQDLLNQVTARMTTA